jgi:chemosensory pili system protein ChpA (sensor histidine kinase/response regulator)
MNNDQLPIAQAAQVLPIESIESAVPEQICAQLTLSTEDLSAALSACVSLENDDPAILETSENYINQVLDIRESAKMAGLSGLQVVCTFVNNNWKAFIIQEKDQKVAIQTYFEQWPAKVLEYLQEPSEGAGHLVSFMQDTGWPVPLKAKAASHLLSLLTTKAAEPTEEQVSETPPPESAEAASHLLSLLTTKAAEPTEEQVSETPPPESIDLIAPDVLELICAQLKDSTDELSAALSACVSLENDDPAGLETSENYTNQVEALWEAAEMAGLSGLQEVCTFVNDNWMAFSLQDKDQKVAIQTYFEQWPAKVLEYLQEPSEGAGRLVSFMQDAGWPAPLEAEAANHLLTQLTTKAAEQTAASGEVSDTQPPESIDLIAPDVLELICAQLKDSTEDLSSALSACVSLENDDPARLEISENYTNQVEALWEAAEMAGLSGLQEVCTFVNENWMAFSLQDKDQKVAIQTYFEQWPAKVLEYLQEPSEGAGRLVSFMQDAGWPAPLEAEAANHLLTQLTTKAAEQTAASGEVSDTQPPESIDLIAPDVLELICAQLKDSTEDLSSALSACVSLENDDPARLEISENYTNQVEALWEAAEMAGLSGLQEVCTFVNENWMAFSLHDKDQKVAIQTYFEQWPAKVLEYLQEPSEGAGRLVSFMQDAGWPVPLEAEAASHLLTMLTASEEVSETPPPVALPIDVDTQSLNIEPKSRNTQQDNEDDDDKIKISLDHELLEMLRNELESAKEELATELNKFSTLANTDVALVEASEKYTEIVQNLSRASSLLRFEGLQTVCAFIISNVSALSVANTEARAEAKKLLEAWPNLVLAYLHTPNDSVIPMVNHFRDPQWAKPLSDDKAQSLLNQVIEVSRPNKQKPKRPPPQPEDVVINIPGDIDQQLWEAYLQETPDNAAQFSAIIQEIIQNPETSQIKEAQRLAHSLKGSSNIIGIKAIANIAHPLEDSLEYLATNHLVPPKALTDMMVEAADCLENMVETLSSAQPETPPEALSVLQSVVDWANRIDEGDIDAQPIDETNTQTFASTAPKPTATAAGTPEPVLKVPTKTIDELMRLVGELSISVGQIKEKLKHLMLSTHSLSDQNLILQQRTFDLEELVDVRGVTGVRSQKTAETKLEDEFDPLEFEEFNELHSVAHSFIESIADNRELGMSIRDDLIELETMFVHQERLNKDFETNIMKSRMVSVNNLVGRLQRNVRQTCRMTGKQAELVLSGTDVMIDSEVLNNLADPLQHILRNAIDHGIEKDAKERTLQGKPEAGQIQLSFYREGNNVVVKCEDDGQGLNYSNIRETAIQRGLITENQALTKQELARLILLSGFSTKSGVTQVSGRGVGMDVVHSNISQMKGILDLTSETGKGTTILIKLPMTLVTVHVLLVRIGERKFGIPTNYLEQALAPGVGEINKVGNEISLKIDKNMYALKYLANLLNVPGDMLDIKEEESYPVILAHEETGITAVIVDEFLDTHDLVMKSMGKYVRKIHGVAGASILGDGSLVPLLDLPDLLRSPMQAVMSSYQAVPQAEEAVSGGLPRILIVDDSFSVRKALSLLVEEAGFETLLAKDGVEAIEILNQKQPNVMLVDMEMPRMDGLELTAHVRANQATQKLPIFMITSRTTEKHREQAKAAGVDVYLTKPYQNSDLLNLIEQALEN